MDFMSVAVEARTDPQARTEPARGRFIAAGLMTRAEIDAALDLLAAPGFSFVSQLTMAAWGRRPAARS
jgi:hypothetical protein